MRYLYALVVVSALFVLLERALAWRKEQRQLRPGLVRDLGFLAVNGYLFSLATGGAARWLSSHADALAAALGLDLGTAVAAGWSLPVQLVVFFLLADLMQWCIHNLLHRVPWLWTYHKVHHSIDPMDWLGNFHFHWAEPILYRALQYVPLTLLGASGDAIFVVAVFGTFWGHLNHSNLDAGLGPLGYVFNSPRMHLWHHDASDEGGVAKNYGIVLSLWDWVFRTAYWPRDRSPAQLGYRGMAEMPSGLARQLLWPLTRQRP